MGPTTHLAKISTIDCLVHTFNQHSIVEVAGSRCGFFGNTPSLGDECGYIGEGALISKIALWYAVSHLSIGKTVPASKEVEGNIRRMFKNNGKLNKFPSFRGIYVSNKDLRQQGVAFSIDIIRAWDPIVRQWEVGDEISEDLGISRLPLGIVSENQLLNPRDVGVALEATNLEKLEELFNNGKVLNKTLLGDGNSICSQLEIDKCNQDKLKLCVDFLISKRYFLSRTIGSEIIRAGWGANKRFLVELGIRYGGSYSDQLKQSIKAWDEYSVKYLIDLAIKYKNPPSWPDVMKIAEYTRNQSMIKLLCGYGAVRTPWSLQRDKINSYDGGVTDEGLDDVISEYGPSSWVDRSCDDELE